MRRKTHTIASLLLMRIVKRNLKIKRVLEVCFQSLKIIWHGVKHQKKLIMLKWSHHNQNIRVTAVQVTNLMLAKERLNGFIHLTVRNLSMKRTKSFIMIFCNVKVCLIVKARLKETCQGLFQVKDLLTKTKIYNKSYKEY